MQASFRLLSWHWESCYSAGTYHNSAIVLDCSFATYSAQIQGISLPFLPPSLFGLCGSIPSEREMSGSSNVGMHIDHCLNEDPAKLADFESKMTRGDLIEADDWMPEAYRTGMLKMAE